MRPKEVRLFYMDIDSGREVAPSERMLAADVPQFNDSIAIQGDLWFVLSRRWAAGDCKLLLKNRAAV